MLLLCFVFTGCASLQERIDEYSKDKVECYLNEVNVGYYKAVSLLPLCNYRGVTR